MGSLSGTRITIDKAKLAEVETLLADIKNGSTRALVRAINKTLRGAETDAAREASQVLNLTQSRIKDNFTLTKASYSRIAGKFDSTGKPIPLIDYGAKGLKSGGISVKVKKNGGSKKIRHAFVARMPLSVKGGGKVKSDKGHLGIFQRIEGAGSTKPSAEIRAGTPIGQAGAETYFTFPGKWVEEMRLPIGEMHGSRVEDVLGDVLPQIQEKVNERFTSNLDHEVDYLISQQQESGDGF